MLLLWPATPRIVNLEPRGALTSAPASTQLIRISFDSQLRCRTRRESGAMSVSSPRDLTLRGVFGPLQMTQCSSNWKRLFNVGETNFRY